MTDGIDCIVVGAGVVGLAIARRLALTGREVVVLETEDHIVSHASSRNSEVIHAGIYYPTDSLKAGLCVSGRDLLYRYCDDKSIDCRKIGKIIVATDAVDIEALRSLRAKATGNGVADLSWLERDAVLALEPEVDCVAGLLSPSTGIIDSHAYALSLQADLEAAGGAVLCRSAVESVEISGGEFHIHTAEASSVRCKLLVNAAGLWAQQVAQGIEGLSDTDIPALYPVKGHYFSYQGKSPFKRLVYPMPGIGGLGIHATIDMAGSTRFGPDVCWIDAVDYDFDDGRREIFSGAIQRYYPALDSSRLQPSYTGIRANISGPDTRAADFVIQSERDHGVDGLINLFGIESPGLTASLAIADYVCAATTA